MTRIWREAANQLVALYLVLDLLELIYSRTAGAQLNVGIGADGQLWWIALDAFLLWRVWRGSGISWMILLLLNGWIVFVLAFGMMSSYEVGLLALTAAQIALLCSPAVRYLRKV